MTLCCSSCMQLSVYLSGGITIYSISCLGKQQRRAKLWVCINFSSNSTETCRIHLCTTRKLNLSVSEWNAHFHEYLCCKQQNWKHRIDINSSVAGDGIFRLWGSIPCLVTPWIEKSPDHQQALYQPCRTGNIYCCPRANFAYLDLAKFKIWFKMWYISLAVFKKWY